MNPFHAMMRMAGRLGLRVLTWPPVTALLPWIFPIRPVIREGDPSRDLDALALFGTPGRPDHRPMFRAALEQEFQTATPETHRFLVARAASGSHRLAGYIRLQVRMSAWWITGLEVRPMYRRRGLAEALAREAMGRLRNDGAGTICLSVRGDNVAAIRLYEKLGFRREEGLSDPTLRPGDIGMVWRRP